MIRTTKLQNIKTSHLQEMFFITSEENSFLEDGHCLLFVDSFDKLYSFSLPVYEKLVKEEKDTASVITINDEYDLSLDIFLHNTFKSVVISHKKVSKIIDINQARKLAFDKNQIDLMYSNNEISSNIDYSIKVINPEKLSLKKSYFFSIALDNIEDNVLLQKFLNSDKEVVPYRNFYKAINGQPDIFDIVKKDSFFRRKVYSEIKIQCSDHKEINCILDFFGINNPDRKTTRVKFSTIKHKIINHEQNSSFIS